MTTTRLKWRAMIDRYQEFVSVLGSLRLEGAEPSPEMIALGEAWGRGELTTAELEAATDRIAATAAQRIAAGQHPLSRPATAA
jgi:hypothetical protein